MKRTNPPLTQMNQKALQLNSFSLLTAYRRRRWQAAVHSGGDALLWGTTETNHYPIPKQPSKFEYELKISITIFKVSDRGS